MTLPASEVMLVPPPPVIVSDWDNTLAPGFLVLPWAEFLAERTLVDRSRLVRMSDATERYRSGDVDYLMFADEIILEYSRAIHDLEVDVLLAAAQDFSKSYAVHEKMFPLGQFLLQSARDHGAEIHIISAAPIEPLAACLRPLGVDNVVGLSVASSEGRIDAARIVFAGGADDKARIVEKIAETRQIVLALGDSVSDLPLLEAAEHSIVVDGVIKDAPAGAVRANGSAISSDLRVFIDRVLRSAEMPDGE